MITSEDYKKLSEDARSIMNRIIDTQYTQELADEFAKWKLTDRGIVLESAVLCKTPQEGYHVLYGYYVTTKEFANISKVFDGIDIFSLLLIYDNSENHVEWMESEKSVDDLVKVQLFVSYRLFYHNMIKSLSDFAKLTLCPILNDIHAIIASAALNEKLSKYALKDKKDEVSL